MELTKEELGGRIQAARESCCLTQEQLGVFAGLSRVAIGQIESGMRSVSSLELDRIARAVGRDIQSFFVSSFVERDALAAHFRSDAALALQADLVKVLQDSLELGHEMTKLERLLEIDRVHLVTASYELPAPKSSWDAIQQGAKVATEERQRLGLGVAPIGVLSDLLEAQGVRTGVVALPENVSGLTLVDSTIGVFVVINAKHAAARRRFSLAHEYGHVLLDREHPGVISRAENRSDLLEVRANAFAAEFLMPAEGVTQFVVAFGKGGASRAHVAVFDEAEAVQVEQRAAPGSRDIQLYDVALLAHHFGMSRISALYRIKNLRLISDREFQRLKAEEGSGVGQTIANFLAAPEAPLEDLSRDDFQRRFLALALEAYRREEITRSKLADLARMVKLSPNDLRALLASTKLD
ncbi:ImmA/IrrE family metallo-endopeptidase [Verrucomicrobium sp. 3C]|uniref:helix-turn-helix domain-containing protein n=1 Tax=Verrucomicrobium sp. 3C TaxID=1134055 RepID=UPI0003661B91|nr:XRE family transcriptional regulator [Verrucomicrobium sp. 3C]